MIKRERTTLLHDAFVKTCYWFQNNCERCSNIECFARLDLLTYGDSVKNSNITIITGKGYSELPPLCKSFKKKRVPIKIKLQKVDHKQLNFKDFFS